MHTISFFAVDGDAKIIRDATQFDAHWNEGLNRWFTDGPCTAAMVMLHVQAQRIHYWDAEMTVVLPFRRFQHQP